MGIGQFNWLSDSLNGDLTYLPWMYYRDMVWVSKKRSPIASYDGIVRPFDMYTWSFILGVMLAVFLLLRVMEKLWPFVSGQQDTKNYLYEGC